MNDMSGKRLLWILPELGQGASGGLQTIFRHISYLQKRGTQSDVILIAERATAEYELRKRISKCYDCDGIRIVDFATVDGSDYDMCVATMNTTVQYALTTGCSRIAYFVQDYEPWFYPMGDSYVNAAATYSDDVTPITIGRWLSAKLSLEHGVQSYVTCFGSDSSIYRPLPREAGDKTRTEQAICVIWQPEKPHRCAGLVESTMRVFHALCPDVKIYLYGSNKRSERLEGVVEHLGILTKQECNELYNRCLVGLSMSSSNPSRIPFEMMSAGLPVVDWYQANNLYDLPDGPVRLAKPTPDALASALAEVVGDKDLQADLSKQAIDFMAARPIHLETEEFANAVYDICQGGRPTIDADPHRRLYDCAPIEASNHAREIWRGLQRMDLLESFKPLNGRYVRVMVSSSVKADGWKAFVWHDENQRDMRCYALHPSVDDASRHETVFDLDDHDSFSGRYHIHVYATIDGQDLIAAIVDQDIAHPDRESLARKASEEAVVTDTSDSSSRVPEFPFAVLELESSESAPQDVAAAENASHESHRQRGRRRGLIGRFVRGRRS